VDIKQYEKRRGKPAAMLAITAGQEREEGRLSGAGELEEEMNQLSSHYGRRGRQVGEAFFVKELMKVDDVVGDAAFARSNWIPIVFTSNEQGAVLDATLPLGPGEKHGKGGLQECGLSGHELGPHPRNRTSARQLWCEGLVYTRVTR